jgi:hypothetical protein
MNYKTVMKRKKKGKEHGLRNGFVEEICMVVMIESSIRKKDTAMRMAIPTRTKFEITLRYLASGDSFRTLHHLYRVPAPF